MQIHVSIATVQRKKNVAKNTKRKVFIVKNVLRFDLLLIYCINCKSITSEKLEILSV
jgi:hypothetical protein